MGPANNGIGFGRRRNQSRGSSLGLRKVLEHTLPVLRGDTDAAVVDRQHHIHAALTLHRSDGTPHLDTTLHRELERVSDQVVQDLANPQRIPEHPWRSLDMSGQRQRTLLGLGPGDGSRGTCDQ